MPTTHTLVAWPVIDVVEAAIERDVCSQQSVFYRETVTAEVDKMCYTGLSTYKQE